MYTIVRILLLVCCLALPLPSMAAQPGKVLETPSPQISELNKDMIISRQTPKIAIDIRYPVLGQPRIDSDIVQWTTQLADNFQSDFAEEGAPRSPYELKGSYSLTRSSENAMTLVWDVASYTGGAHGNLDIITFSYRTADGTPLELFDLFHDLETALNSMSAYSYRTLSETLGDMRVEDMLRGGSTPDADNFSSFALTPEGIRIYFQPYQVAPWAAGPQKVDIPLEELLDAGPRMELWGK